MSRSVFHRKTGVDDVAGQCMLIGGGPSGAIGSLSGRVARWEGNLNRFRSGLSCTPLFSIPALVDNGMKSSNIDYFFCLTYSRKLHTPLTIRKITLPRMYLSSGIIKTLKKSSELFLMVICKPDYAFVRGQKEKVHK
jgi:hypothetical protein